MELAYIFLLVALLVLVVGVLTAKSELQTNRVLMVSVMFVIVALLTSCVPPPDGTTAEQWAKLRHCESGAHGLYKANTGNGYYGAYQFHIQTWRGQGGKGFPHEAPYWEQDARAFSLYKQRGHRPWPKCGRYLR